MKKLVVSGALALGSVAPVFAEGTGGSSVELPISVDTFQGYISAGNTAVVALLTAGAVIVVAFVAYKWLKRAFNRAG